MTATKASKAFDNMFDGAMTSLASLTNYPSRISQQIAEFETHETLAYHTTTTGHRLELKDKLDGKRYEIIITPLEAKHEL